MHLVLKFFGQFEVWHDEQLVKNWPRHKTKELLKLLASERGRSFTQDQLIEMLFPDLKPAKAINNLQKRISEMRRVFEPGLTQGKESKFIHKTASKEQGYYFSKSALCWLDTEEFQKHLETAQSAEKGERWAQAAESYQQAIDLYRGDFLSEDLYEEWTIALRERWREKYLFALAHLAECHARLGQLTQAIECCKRALEQDVCNESIYRQKVLFHYHAGEYSKALETYKSCTEQLKSQLGVDLSPETQQLYQQILKHEVPPLLRIVPNNLPQQLTSFIGREQEIVEIKTLLTGVGAQHAAPLQRLMTLTGVGGCGKTRLALEIGSEVLKEYPDGVWIVELASISDANLVVQALASALGLREHSGSPLLTSVLDYLHSKRLLLILDNCEHLVEACAKLVQEFLKSCPKLQIMATSREALGIIGETLWQVLPLAVPELGTDFKSLATLTQFESVHLFIERARSSDSYFELTQENAQAVAQVCQQLDGIPLAIELAAARVRVLSVGQIAERLNDRFHLLARGNRAVLQRHQTLQATMDWSYQLLSVKEQALLRRLSVFAGGWTLEAAEKVCADGPESRVDSRIASEDILDLLTHLVDKSLVIFEKKGEAPRYKLLETVRQYASERLQEAGETEILKKCHLEFFLKLAEEAEPNLVGPNQKLWLDRLETEHLDLRAALDWSLIAREEEKNLRLATTLGQFWLVRGYWTEGQEVLFRALESDEAISEELQAKALRWAGLLVRRRGDPKRAKELYSRSLDLSRKVGDCNGIAKCLIRLGYLASDSGDYAEAQDHFDQSLVIMRELMDKQDIAMSLRGLGFLAHEQGNYAKAQRFFEQSLAIFQELGNKREIAGALINFGTVADDQGNYAIGQQCNEQSLAIMREIGDKYGISISLNNLGEIAMVKGDYAAAQSFFEKSLSIRREIGEKQGIGTSLKNLGIVTHRKGDFTKARGFLEQSLVTLSEIRDKYNIAFIFEELARLAYSNEQMEHSAQLLGAAEALREIISAPMPANKRVEYDHNVATVRTTFGEEAFSKAWAEGRAMTLEQAIAYALGKTVDE